MAIFDAREVEETRTWSKWGLAWRLLVALAAALGTFALCVWKGYRAADQCAIDYPHDGQCALAAMGGDIAGLLGGFIVLAIGVSIVLVRLGRRDRD